MSRSPSGGKPSWKARKQAAVAQRLGKEAADISSEREHPPWYDRIEEMTKRYAARHRRRASCKKENRSTSGGDRSKFEGDRSNSRRDAEKNARAPHISVAVTTKS